MLSIAERGSASYLLSAVERPCRQIVAMDLSDLIRRYRNEKGLTQRELADVLGVNKSAVAQWELGSTTPTTANMSAIKLALNISQHIAVAGDAPFTGQLVEDPGEIALLQFWRGLSPAKKGAFADLLQIGAVSTRKVI